MELGARLPTYLTIKTQYLGESYSTRVRAATDSTIESAYYDGKSRLFTFERYCEVLKAAFTDIETTGEEVSETRKVRILYKVIKTNVYYMRRHKY
jgi:hypothetical protein